MSFDTAEAGKNFLSVVVPAYNEEDSVLPLIDRMKAGRDEILNRGGLSGIEFIFVDDGSTDSTLEKMRARENDIRIVRHEVNRGYGAALKSGFRAARGNLLAFLDCDGTCDPVSLGEMCSILQKEDAGMVIGNRMDRTKSHMPGVRRLGNLLFAWLLSILSGKKIKDTASGIRVLRRDTYEGLGPLPDGLNFTPAMTARALHADVKVVEIPVDYAHREGRSKLSVFSDGIRFLWTILEVVLLYNPLKVFAGVAVLFFMLGLVLMALPAWDFISGVKPPYGYYIYRMIMAVAAFLVGLQVLLFGIVGGSVVNTFFHPHNKSRRTQRVLERLGFFKHLTVYGFIFISVGVCIAAFYGLQYLRGGITMHWSWLLMGTGCLIAGVQMAASGLVLRVIERIQR